ncbi:MAG: hypothetical protein ACYTGG_04010 [Planctomycetota bacterium]|jgi:hypothetical protein
MPVPAASLLESVGSLLDDFPEVFSTPQWGGRAYKLPGPGGRRRKPKLLAFVAPADDGRGVTVSFKLEASLAARSIDRYAWIASHAFGTLGRSGWVTAAVTNRRQLTTLARLLAESRALHPPAEDRGESPSGRVTSATARHIERVMRDATSSGWTPPELPEDS